MNAQPGDALAIVGGRLIDGTGGPPRAKAALVMRERRIVAVGDTGSIATPRDDTVIRADGQWVAPADPAAPRFDDIPELSRKQP